MIRIFHNPRCKKSRAGLNYLKEKGIEPEVVHYMKNPPHEEELKRILQKLNKKPAGIIRTQEALYKSDYKDKDFTDGEWVKILTENPRLIRRPIVVKGYKAVIGDPPENIDHLL
ncbi:MAG: arsenate reductase (glutaredoxin) [Bacteroidales bacterium]